MILRHDASMPAGKEVSIDDVDCRGFHKASGLEQRAAKPRKRYHDCTLLQLSPAKQCNSTLYAGPTLFSGKRPVLVVGF